MYFQGGVASAALTINADHSFTLNFSGGGAQDSGTWQEQGKIIALGINSSTFSDQGCVFMAKVSTKGFGSAKKPAPYTCPGGFSNTWYATPGVPPARGGATSVTSGASIHPVVPVGSLYEQYNVEVGDMTRLALNADGTSSQVDFGNSGQWLQYGSEMTFADTSSDGCIFLGKVGTKSINSAKKPGPYACPGGYNAHWYALKLA
ncbi:MAG TPA: hypothetical protein VKG43_02280 [Acidimicrobiales bacterium]|nr:hypothetical protein [Acidimicrobiales bacterium]